MSTEVHLTGAIPFVAVCGADESNQMTTTVSEHVTCMCCLGFHRWIGRKNPDTADGPGEWIEYCGDCGLENPGSWVP